MTSCMMIGSPRETSLSRQLDSTLAEEAVDAASEVPGAWVSHFLSGIE